MDSEDTHGGAEEEDEEERSDNDNDFRAEEQEEGLDNGGVDDAYAEAQEAMKSGTRMTCVCLFVCVYVYTDAHVMSSGLRCEFELAILLLCSASCVSSRLCFWFYTLSLMADLICSSVRNMITFQLPSLVKLGTKPR